MITKIYKNGDNLEISIEITNLSTTVTASNTILTLTNDAGVSFVTANTNSYGLVTSVNATTTSWEVGGVLPEQSLSGIFTFNIDDQTSAPWTFTWVVTTDTPESTLDNNTGTVTFDPLTEYKIKGLDPCHLKRAFITITENYTATEDDSIIFVDNTAGPVNVNIDPSTLILGGCTLTIDVRVIGVTPGVGFEVTITALSGKIVDNTTIAAAGTVYSASNVGDNIPIASNGTHLFIH